MPPSLRDLLVQPGSQDIPEYLRPYVEPLTHSIAAPAGKMLPSRSGGILQPEEFVGSEPTTEWTPWGLKVIDPRSRRLSSGPLAGTEGRPSLGVAYAQESGLWNLSGVASGWSRPLAPTPGRQPTVALAMGTWTPFGGATPPLPGNPSPAPMLTPAGP